MQQPMPPQDQLAAQQLQQQMVLCPVRVVYETQILVQPGDQIQPNQTLFINPQNPPPWAQSRPVQNQVIYVQQMPGNIVPSLQQHIDQNQLYLHQYPGYQQGVQMIPQQMVQNMQENRANTIQMPNLIQQNMLQNFQANLASNMSQNMQTLPDRTIQQSYGQMHPNVGPNMQIQQAQINLASNNVMSRQNENIANIAQAQQSQYNAPKVEMKQTYIGQMNQPANVGRPPPQVLTVNPMQNMPQTSNVQTFAPIVRPIKTESVASQMTPPTFVNATQNTQVTRIRKLPANNASKINPTIGIRSVGQTQTYRPIQPRPIQQFRAALPNYSTVEPLSQANSMPILNQNVANVNSNIPIQNVSANTMNFIRTEDLNMNRKRKSESPDEIHKKMAAIQVNIATPIKQMNDITKRSSEIGVNMSPLQKSQVTITPGLLQPNNVKIDVQSIYNNMPQGDAKNISYLIQNIPQTVNNEQINAAKPSLEPIEQNTTNNNATQKEVAQNTNLEKDKLIRNTVYTQARGRVLTDKEALSIPTEISIPESVSGLKEITVTPRDPNVEMKTDVNVETDKKLTQNIDIVKMEAKSDAAEDDNKVKVIEDIVVNKIETKDVKIKEEKKEPADMKVSLNTTNNKGMFPMDRAVKQEKDYILTHVLDGIVIQESNVAFPIREPLIKRITQSTAQVANEVKDKDKDIKDVKEATIVKETPTVKETKQNDNKSCTNQGVTQGDNPFLNLSSATVKSWTTQQLSSHLSRHGWEDTASLFVEHEIDGESLYLVSKAQLETIGVKEEQADTICAFVKS